ncbi:MAG: TonB C-terminal domain-containing protein [Emcibacter sp.]|nr:TonB C-terminal domain-containing protein [Emcibacter sp.]
MSKLLGKLSIYVTAMVVLSFGLVGVTGTAHAASDIKKWQTKIVKLVAKKQVYPRSAMRKELEGRAKVRVSIDRTGAIVAHEIVTPTGLAVFDKEIPKLIKRINPLPKPPASLTDNQLSFVLPLSWVIR